MMLFVRCTEMDKRISIVVEDDTSTRNASNQNEENSRIFVDDNLTHRSLKESSRGQLFKKTFKFC